MATHFESIELDSPELFGVKLSGTVSPGDKDNLRDLAAKCLEHGQTRVIVDLSGLGALGGGGASALADFQSNLVAAGGGAAFVGAGEVMRHFLEQKFVDVPLHLYADMAHAVAGTDEIQVSDTTNVDPEPEAPAAEIESAPEPVVPATATATLEPATNDTVEIGDTESGAAMEEVLEKVPNSAATNGRRKQHQYTSLSEAIEALGGWNVDKDLAEFSRALGNLLYSHGLAEETVLLARQGKEFVDAGGERRIPVACELVQVAQSMNRPLTLLDFPAEDLSDEDAILLEVLAPDVILPIIRDNALEAMVLLHRENGDHDFNVAENFALELMMRMLNSSETTGNSQRRTRSADREDDEADGPGSWEPDGTTAAEVLLQLALDLPEAVDRPHFWRIFARHCWPVLPLAQLAFLEDGRTRPQIMAGGNDSWLNLDLSGDKLQLFLQSMERPVAVGNMPSFFAENRDQLIEVGAAWIVALKWEGEFLGTVLLQLDPGFHDPDPTELLEELFIETSRLLARFHDSHENADVNLELVRILVAQAEKRRLGSNDKTAHMVKNVVRLARVMAFPPDQERDLVYGCLLRDIGLMDKRVDFPQGDRNWSTEQREIWRAHPEEGAVLTETLKLPATIVDVIRHHHEHFDGTGFPRGLQGHNIPLVARVVAIAEHYAEMVTGSDGQSPLSPLAAAELLRRGTGTHFDPDLVELFLKAVLPGGPRRPRGRRVPPVPH